MPKKKVPTVPKNLRIPITADRWLAKKSRVLKETQTWLILDALASKYPELKGILS